MRTSRRPPWILEAAAALQAARLGRRRRAGISGLSSPPVAPAGDKLLDIIHAITAATGLDGESVRNVRVLVKALSNFLEDSPASANGSSEKRFNGHRWDQRAIVLRLQCLAPVLARLRRTASLGPRPAGRYRVGGQTGALLFLGLV